MREVDGEASIVALRVSEALRERCEFKKAVRWHEVLVSRLRMMRSVCEKLLMLMEMLLCVVDEGGETDPEKYVSESGMRTRW